MLGFFNFLKLFLWAFLSTIQKQKLSRHADPDGDQILSSCLGMSRARATGIQIIEAVQILLFSVVLKPA